MIAANSARKQRGRPFKKGKSGNPSGRPRGARCHVTMLAETLLDGEAPALVRKAIEMALAGDTTALRLCLERIIAPRRDRPVRFTLPALDSANDAARAMAAITSAVARGDLTPSEAGELSRLVEAFVTALEAVDFEQRLQALENAKQML
ncbi:MAG: DUF5681 domain-containing protein [Alphaproteobacteria bacterium]